MDKSKKAINFISKAVFVLVVFCAAFAGNFLAGKVSAKPAALGVEGDTLVLKNPGGEKLATIYPFDDLGAFFQNGESKVNFVLTGSGAGIFVPGEEVGENRASLQFSVKEGVLAHVKDEKGVSRLLLNTEGDSRGIVMTTADGKDSAFSLKVREKEGGGGRLFLGTPKGAARVVSGFDEGGAPFYLMETADGASFSASIKNGAPELVLVGKDGRRKTIAL